VEREGPEEKQERKANRSKNPFGDDKAAPAPSNDSHSMMPPPPPPLAASNPRLNAPNASLSKTDSSKSGPDRLMPPLFLTSEPGTGMSSKATTSMPHPFTPRSQWATPTGAPRGPKSMSTPSGFTPLDRNERTASNEKTSIDTGESKFVPKKKNMTRHEIDRRERWNNMGRGRRDAVSGPTGPPLEGLGNVIQQITTSFAPSPLDAAVVRQHTSHTGGAARSISVPSNHTAIPIYTAAYPPNLDPSDVGYETAIGGTDSSHAAAYGSSGNSPEASTDGAQRSDPSDPSNKDSDSDSDSKEPKKDPSPPPPPPSSPSDSSPPPPPPPPAAVNPNPDPTSFLNACDLCGDDCFCQNMFPDCLFPDQLCFCPNCTYRTARHGQPAVPGQPHQPPNSPADLTFPQPTTVAEYTAAAVALYPSPDQTPARPVHRHHRAVSNSVRISTPDGKKVERFGQDGPNFWDDIKDGKGGREDDGEDGAGAGAGAGTAI
jgi:hypothetical protein